MLHGEQNDKPLDSSLFWGQTIRWVANIRRWKRLWQFSSDQPDQSEDVKSLTHHTHQTCRGWMQFMSTIMDSSWNYNKRVVATIIMIIIIITIIIIIKVINIRWSQWSQSIHLIYIIYIYITINIRYHHQKTLTHSICFTPPIVPGTESDPPAPETAPWTPAATLQPWRGARAPGLGPWKATRPRRWWGNPGGWRIFFGDDVGNFCWGIHGDPDVLFFGKWGKYSIAPHNHLTSWLNLMVSVYDIWTWPYWIQDVALWSHVTPESRKLPRSRRIKLLSCRLAAKHLISSKSDGKCGEERYIYPEWPMVYYYRYYNYYSCQQTMFIYFH